MIFLFCVYVFLRALFHSSCLHICIATYLASHQIMWHNKRIHSRSNRLEVFCKKDVPRNFAKFTGQHLCQGLFFNCRPEACTQLYEKRDSGSSALRTPVLIKRLWWLLLSWPWFENYKLLLFFRFPWKLGLRLILPT